MEPVEKNHRGFPLMVLLPLSALLSATPNRRPTQRPTVREQ
jgi:hypothetical protein